MKYSIIVAAALALASGIAQAETQMTGDSGPAAGEVEGTTLSPQTGGENAVAEGASAVNETEGSEAVEGEGGDSGEQAIIENGDGEHAGEGGSEGEHSEGGESHGEHSDGDHSGGDHSGGDHSGDDD